MRIAFFVGAFPAVSETFILGQITGLLADGHDVDVYAESRPPAGTPVHPDVTRCGILERTAYVGEQMPTASGCWEMPVWPVRGETWLPGAAEPLLNSDRWLEALPTLLSCLSAVPQLTLRALDPAEYGTEASSLSSLYRLAALRSVDRTYDVLHAHFGPIGRTYRFARDLFRAPLVVTFHGYDFTSVPRKEGLGCYERLWESADVVTVNCGHAGDRLRALGCPPAKIRPLNVGIEVGTFEFRERRLAKGETVRLLTVGRLVEKKGVEFALRALDRTRRVHPDVRYDVVGDGPLRTPLEDLAQRLGIAAHVRFHGAQPSDVVRNVMAAAHVFLLPSVTAADGDQEGTPVSLMEAQASGLPVLSTRHSGIPEVVPDGVSGYLVPERDEGALAERLTELVINPQPWPEMGRRGRAHVERHFDLAHLNRQLVSLYASLASPQRAEDS